jgi:poly(A) polymerase
MYLQTVEDLDLYAKPEAFRPLTRIARFLIEEGIPSFLVGGFVRDVLLGRDTADVDIAVDGDALETAHRAAEALGGRYVPLDAENGIGRVVLSDSNTENDVSVLYIDFSTLRGNIENDLSKRDFTVNAMAIQLDESSDTGFDTGRIIDPFGGHDDIRQKQIRAIDDDIFRADAVRLLRAVRIATELDFSINSDTETLITRDCRLIGSTAGERTREELLRILAIPGAGPRLTYMDRLGLLTAVIPELSPARGVDQPKIHYWDVYNHSIQTVATAEFLLREQPWEHAGEDVLVPVPWADELKAHFDSTVGSNSTRGSLLKLAALLHDIAKPKTKTIDDDGRARFLGHSQEGAAIATEILERLRFSNKEIRYVVLLINQHLRPTQMSQEGMPSNRAIYRFFRDTGESYIDLLFLCLADHLATRGPELNPEQWHEHTKLTEYVLNAHREKATLSAPPKLLDGNDLIKEFGMQPGPEIGKVLETLREAQAAGEIATRQEASDFVKQFLEDNPGEKPDITGRMEE